MHQLSQRETETRGGPPPGGETKYLTFSLGESQFGIGLMRIREIIGMLPIRPIPRTPAFIKGVINLRGRVISVVDLRERFDLAARPYDERTCIIVVEVQTGAERTSLGVVVDAVNEVANVRGDQLEPPPTFGVAVDSDYIQGLAKDGEAVRILLDIDRVLGFAEPGRPDHSA
ncbi:MAG: chemotaxis protein CheW [Pseudomonadota bacterium]